MHPATTLVAGLLVVCTRKSRAERLPEGLPSGQVGKALLGGQGAGRVHDLLAALGLLELKRDKRQPSKAGRKKNKKWEREETVAAEGRAGGYLAVVGGVAAAAVAVGLPAGLLNGDGGLWRGWAHVLGSSLLLPMVKETSNFGDMSKKRRGVHTSNLPAREAMAVDYGGAMEEE